MSISPNLTAATDANPIFDANDLYSSIVQEQAQTPDDSIAPLEEEDDGFGDFDELNDTFGDDDGGGGGGAGDEFGDFSLEVESQPPLVAETTATVASSYDSEPEGEEEMEKPSVPGFPWSNLPNLGKRSEPFNWKQSELRRDFLKALGLTSPPVSTTSIATTSITSIPTPSTMLNSHSSKDPTSNSNSSSARVKIGNLGRKPDWDIKVAQEYAWIGEANLRSMSNQALLELSEVLEGMNKQAAAHLELILDTRERARLDSEMQHKVIENLVEHAQKKKDREQLLKTKRKTLRERLTMIGASFKTTTAPSTPTAPSTKAHQAGGGGGEEARRLSM